MDRYPYIRTLIQIQLEKLSPKTVVDVGAYTGDFLKEISGIYKSVAIHAIEPDAKCAEAIRMIDCPSIVLHKIAISSFDGEVTLYSEEKDGPSASNTIYEGLLDKRALAITERVPCVTFSKFCDTEKIDEIDLLIINAEGAEYEMFTHEPSLKAVMKSRIIDLSMHGKSLYFNTKEFAQKRIDINKQLLRNGYKILYGEVIDDLALAENHIRQVWIK